MRIRIALSKIFGLAQIAVGALAMVFAFLSFYNIFGTQTILGISGESAGLYLWVFIIFGLLSAISGIFLFYEQQT